MRDTNLKTNGKSYLFFYIILCSYVNFRTSYERIESTYFTVYPGHWVCRLSEMATWFRTRNKKQTVEILDKLSEKKLISYRMLHNDKIVTFKINGWKLSNAVLEYNAVCQKNDGFFFFPISKALKLIDGSKCSEADILLDMWLHTILNDIEVKGSNLGPIVFFREFRETALVSNSELSKRWGVSRTTVFRILKKFKEKEIIDIIHFSGTSGSIIYVKNYMQTTFEVENLYIDKNEVITTFNLEERIRLQDIKSTFVSYTISEQNRNSLDGSKEEFTGSKTDIPNILFCLHKILINKGFEDCSSTKTIYKLSTLSLDCNEYINNLLLTVSSDKKEYYFEISLKDIEDG